MTRRELLKILAKAEDDAVRNNSDSITAIMLIAHMVKELDLQASIDEEMSNQQPE